jgi:hypothetical protein
VRACQRSWEEERASLQAHIDQLKKDTRSSLFRGSRKQDERVSASGTFSASSVEMELADLQAQMEEARDKEVSCHSLRAPIHPTRRYAVIHCMHFPTLQSWIPHCTASVRRMQSAMHPSSTQKAGTAVRTDSVRAQA